jgi:hypothetical protein
MDSEETKCVGKSTLLCDHHLVLCKVREICNTFNNLNNMLRNTLEGDSCMNNTARMFDGMNWIEQNRLLSQWQIFGL